MPSDTPATSTNLTAPHAAAQSAASPRFPLLQCNLTVPILRATGVFGKDLTHHTRVVVTMLVAAGFAVDLPWLWNMITESQNLSLSYEKIRGNASSIYLALLITCAFVFGLVLSADEMENRTLALLDTLPASRMRHLAHKFAAGLIMLIAWAFAAALLMGYLSDNGLKLLHSLLFEKVQLFSIALDFPSSGAVTILQCVSLLFTGLMCGMLFQNLAGGAMVGILAYCCYISLCSHFVYGKNYDPGLITLINIICLLAWIAVMIAAYPRVFRRAHELRSEAAFRFEATSDRWRAITSYLQYRRRRESPKPFDAPYSYLLRLPVLCLSVFAFLYPQLIDNRHNTLVALLYFISVPSALSLIASGVWTSEERFAPKCSIYALPFTRQQIFWPRLAAVAIAGATVAIAGVLGIVFAMYRLSPADLEHFQWEPFLLVIGALMDLALLAAMFRLFSSNRLVAAVLAMIVGFIWLVVAIHSIGALEDLHRYRLGSEAPAPWEVWVYILWIVTVPAALPLLISYLAFCHTKLLETSERTRGTLSLILFLLLIVWGSFFILTEPGQLLTMLFVR